MSNPNPAAHRLGLFLILPIVLGAIAAGFAAFIWGGWALAVFLCLNVIVVWYGSTFLWSAVVRRWGPLSLGLSVGVGLCLGLLASGTTYLTLLADARLGPQLGGSMVSNIMRGFVDTGLQAAINSTSTGHPVGDTLTAPALIVIAPAGAIGGALGAIVLMLGFSALPTVFGLFGGLAAWFVVCKSI
jgi:hypothetical protein